MFKEIVEDARQGMEKVIEILNQNLGRMRTGRANLAILESVRVEYYGTPSPLNQVAALTVADARMITVKPWDKSLLGAIEKAIVIANIGITPANDGEIIRLPIPPLTQERRNDLCKQARKQGEEARVAIRSLRRDANELVKSLQGTSEDEEQRTLKQIQEMTDKFVSQTEAIVTAKEKEINEA
ncbi:MAG: ribosome recycling factor [Myxococcales bacterium]|nr:ribosome recycling factor [Myxococcales bacterium]